MAVVNIVIRDRSDEYSTVSIPVADIANDGSNYSTIQNDVDDIISAIEALTTGEIARRQLVAYNQSVNDVRPANPYAQRELGLRLFYQDTVTQKKYHITVPAPDLLLVASGGTDDVDLSGVAVVNALVTYLETNMKSPVGNPVNFYRGKIVGRRN
ncbi:MAG: hypothetical protein H6662_15770 [Ardenticatenaceae bacterium]|nr:hypothetical protein [Anaerolineales bacterium]MCB8923044.1 hypothetical protein [Ardenticatenaceae bacterium]